MLTGILILIFGACLITLYVLWKLEFLGKYGVAQMVFSQQQKRQDFQKDYSNLQTLF